MVTLPKLVRDHSDLFTLVFGSSDIELLSVTPPETSSPQSICFLSHPSQLPLIENLQSPVWIVTLSFWEKQAESLKTFASAKSAAIVTCPQLQIAMAHVLHYFDQRDKLRSFPDGISPLSWIDPTAQLGSGVTIAPFTTIGPHVHIGDNAVIGPHCIIEGGSKIGQHCYIEGHIFIGRQCEVGDYCRIKPFASIGSDGFGYAPTPQGALKIPQIGNVVLENYVDVGSGTCIDRATMSTTRIGFGTKIDNLVHIAHNCEVGRYCFVTACFAMAGSSKLGDFFMTGGATAVGDHVTITEKVTLAGASVVTSNIDKSGAYGGHPVQPMQDFLRTRSIMTQLPEMRKQLQRIVKHLGLQDQPPKA